MCLLISKGNISIDNNQCNISKVESVNILKKLKYSRVRKILFS